MISCPKCGAENADNANHCGNCGDRLSEGGAAKTMFGFAAISPEAMKQAAEDARAQADAAAEKLKLPKAGLPAPSIPAPTSAPHVPAAAQSGLDTPSSAGFNIPAPKSNSGAKTEMLEPTVNPLAATQLPGSMTQPTPLAEPSPATQPSPMVSGTPATQPSPMVDAPQSTPTPSSFAQPPQSSLMAKPEVSMATNAPGVYQKGEVRDPVKTLLICVLTCGLGQAYMLLKWAEDINGGLGEKKYDGMKILLIGMLTCGLYAIFQLWNMCNDIEEIQRRWGVEPDQPGMNIFLLHFVYVGPMFFQKGLNNAWENGQQPS